MGMSCFAQCVAELASRLCKDVVLFLWKDLKSQAGYLVHYKKKVKKLVERVEYLKDVRSDINRKVQIANKRGEENKDVVTSWMMKVDNLKAEVDNMKEEVEQNKRCLMACSPNCSWCYQLGKKATKKKDEVEVLLREGNFANVSQHPPPPTIESMPVGDFMAFSSTRITMDKVMNALENEKMHLIGIYGMGGVGKTTLMVEIGKRLEYMV